MSGCDGSAADSSAFVYRCTGLLKMLSVSPISCTTPRYITAIRSHIYRTVARLCATIRYASPCSCCKSTSRFIICARMDTSSADTGSSSTMTLGFSDSARATPMRCR